MRYIPGMSFAPGAGPQSSQFGPRYSSQSPQLSPSGASAGPGQVSRAARALGWVVLGLGLIVLLSAFLPWGTHHGDSDLGVDGVTQLAPTVRAVPLHGESVAMIGAGVACLGMARGLARIRSGVHALAASGAVLGGLAVLAFGIRDMVNINAVNDQVQVGQPVGIGLMVAVAFGVFLVIAGVVASVKSE